jgi:hypothetical protein
VDLQQRALIADFAFKGTDMRERVSRMVELFPLLAN